MSFVFIMLFSREILKKLCYLQSGKRVGKALHAPLMKLLQQEESLGKKRQKVGFLG